MTSPRQQPSCYFSNICGQNVQIHNSSAEWSVSYSGGRIFTSRPIKPMDIFVFNLFGSGHVDFGLISVNPDKITNPSTVEKLPEYHYLQTTKVHQIGGRIHIVSSENGDKIICKRDYQECTKDIDMNKQTWITCTILFGNVTVEIEKQPSVNFHDNTGENVMLTENKSRATLKTTHPSSVCFIKQRLYSSENFRFHLEPIKSEGRNPSVYSVRLAISEIDPEHFMKNLQPIFSLEDLPVNIITSETNSYSVEGDINVRICDDGVVSEQNGKPKTVAKTTIDIKQGFFCIFELYRVKLTINERKSSQSEQSVLTRNTRTGICNVAGQDRPKSMSESDKAKFRELHSIINTLESGYHAHSEIKSDFECVRLKLTEIENKMESGAENTLSFQENAIVRRLRENFSNILMYIDALPLADLLFQENCISIEHYQQIRNRWQVDPTNAKRDLLSLLIVRNVDEKLIKKALSKSNQEHVLTMLFPQETNTT